MLPIFAKAGNSIIFFKRSAILEREKAGVAPGLCYFDEKKIEKILFCRFHPTAAVNKCADERQSTKDRSVGARLGDGR